ncbi:MAG: penicillin-binding protein 2 [Patescibacteria group bacterium]|nr:penicillin-binding protein 2 [Patescibacteria group bacterium]
MAIRFWLVIIGVFIGYLGLLGRLYDLQLVRGGQFLARAQSQYRAALSLDAPRGLIYFTDKDGAHVPVALNEDYPLIFAVPKVIEDADEAAHMLARVVNIPVDELFKKFSNKDSLYVLLDKRADAEMVNAIQALNLAGVYVDFAPGRLYPNGAMAAHVLGFVSPDDDGREAHGRYGVEKQYDDVLRGIAGVVDGKNFSEPEAGNNIILTIDPTLQLEAERVLKDIIAEYRAPGGSVIVGDPNTGKILAMGSYPSFNPSTYGSSPLSNFPNPLLEMIYEPGSVLKVVTMAGAIDAGKITPDTIYFDHGKISMNGYTIKNFDYDVRGGHGEVSMTYVIEHSLNTGAVFAQQQLGNASFLSYLQRFGLGDKTGITLPGEVRGSLRPLEQRSVRDIAFATASYGQGIAVTPIELIQAVGAIANGGKLMKPFIDANKSPEIVRRVVSEDAAKQVTQMMISGIDRAGVAKISGYSLAGKTGTAFVPDFKNGGYTENVVNTYVGFGPASNPRFIILLKLNQPPDAPLAGYSVVPAFRNLAQFILNYYNIPPDRISE